MTRRSSVPLVAALVVSIVGAGVARSLVIGQRDRLEAARGNPVAAQADLSKVNSFALGLLLGGLRGPLVMALWTSSENQKTEKNLDDFDTKVELIRLLQPEFDTVHLFQIWNKAYNISVQMANLPNKYTTILDALQYAFSVDAERPNNINILAAIGGLYFDKFGGAAEKGYFSSRLQSETLAPRDRVRVIFDAAERTAVVREARLAGATPFELSAFEADEEGKRLYVSVPESVGDAMQAKGTIPGVTYEPRPVQPGERRDASGRPTQHRVLLDADHMLLPGFVTPLPGQPAQADDTGNGSGLPHLLEFVPFPYGVSPYALAFDYYKRCGWLQDVRGINHAQLSDRVIASRGSMSLEKWCEEEWYTAVRAEIDLAGRPQPGEESQLNTVTPDLVLDAGLPSGPLFDQAIWRFNNASRLAARAAAEYQLHLKGYPDDELTYRSHIRDLSARSALTAGDALYLQAMRTTGDARRDFARRATEQYLRAANLYSRYLFRYFMDDEEGKRVLPQDVRNLKRSDVDDAGRLRDDEVAPALERMRQLHEASQYNLSNSTDFVEIYTYVQRAYARLRTLSLVR